MTWGKFMFRKFNREEMNAVDGLTKCVIPVLNEWVEHGGWKRRANVRKGYVRYERCCRCQMREGEAHEAGEADGRLQRSCPNFLQQIEAAKT